MKLKHSLTPHTTINSAWMKDLGIRPDTIKLLEENIGQMLSDINHSSIFSDPPQSIDNKNKQKGSNQTEKETLIKIKRPPTGEIFANESTDKGLISKIYKQLLQLHTKKTNNPIKKMGRRSKQTVLQRRQTDGQKTHEKMFNITHY